MLFYYLIGGFMTITFEEIGQFLSDNLLWFLIPINIFIVTMLIILIVKVSKAKKRRKNERKRQAKLPRADKKTRKL